MSTTKCCLCQPTVSTVYVCIMYRVVGLYDMLGNVWEWTSTRYYDRVVDRKLQEVMYVVKGGSFIDSREGHCNRIVRTAQRY